MTLAALLRTAEFKVGMLVLLVSGLIATMALKVSEDPSFLGSSRKTWFEMDDASGLVKNSAVKMAGIDVGVIKDIRLENGKARVDMILKGEVPITRSAQIDIRPNGILGDKHVEIIAGNAMDPPLQSGQQILIVHDNASVDRLISEVTKITKTLNGVVENIKAATEGESDKPLGKIVANVQALTEDLAEMSREHKGQIGEIVENVHNITSTLDDLVNDDSPEGFKAAWHDALGSLKRIDKSLKNVEEITDKVNNGEGTIGKLLNDDTTVESINTAIEGVNNLLDTANKMQVAIDYHADYLSRDSSSKSFISLNIQPGLDRYYELGVVDDPHGVVERTDITDTYSAGGTSSNLTETKVYHYKLKINALFAKNFYNFTVKGGIIENTGGAGFDYFLFKRTLRLSIEAFDFTSFHLRASARYTMFHGLYLDGGVDDIAGQNYGPSAYVGAGLFLTSDDLKLLVSRVPL
jgi:phospholipid/cholesterol/gamma-HCH transport system substrate-binding protein